jgi:hypothetical protein
VLGDVHTEEEALGNASAPVGGPAPRHAGPLLGSIGLDRETGLQIEPVDGRWGSE